LVYKTQERSVFVVADKIQHTQRQDVSTLQRFLTANALLSSFYLRVYEVWEWLYAHPFELWSCIAAPRLVLISFVEDHWTTFIGAGWWRPWEDVVDVWGRPCKVDTSKLVRSFRTHF